MINKKCNGIVRVKEHMREGHKVAAYDRRCGRHNYHDYMDFYPSDSNDKVYERERNSRNSKQKGNMLSDSLIALLQLFWAIKDGDTLGYLQAINALANSPFFQVFTDWIGQFGITPDMLDFKERSAEFLASDEGQAELANALQSQTTYPINHNLSEIQQMELPQIKVDLGNTKDFLYQSDNVLFSNLSDLTPSTVGIPEGEKISKNIAIKESVSSKYADMDDVMKLKGALLALGYYKAPKEKMRSPYFDKELEKAISLYQHDMKLPETGIVTPDSPMINKINERLSFYPDGPRLAALHAFLGYNDQFSAYQDNRGKSFTGIVAPLKHMIKNYNDLKEVGIKGADRYFHCKGNYQAGTYGPYGTMLSQLISLGKEIKDIPQYAKEYGWKGSFLDTLNDWKANKSGWEGARKRKSLFESCEQFRPRGLSKKY